MTLRQVHHRLVSGQVQLLRRRRLHASSLTQRRRKGACPRDHAVARAAGAARCRPVPPVPPGVAAIARLLLLRDAGPRPYLR